MEAKDQFATLDHAKIYSSSRRDTPSFLVEKVISYLKEKYDGPLDLAVDVGCGSGQSSVNLARFFKKVHGMDIAEAQIQEAKSNRAMANVSYETAAAEHIPFDNGSIQVVSAGASLHWFQLDKFFPEVRRVLCNNGILVVYVYISIKPLLDNPVVTEKVDKLWKEFHASIAYYNIPQAKIYMEMYKSVTFPFEEIHKFGFVRDVFDGGLQDIVGYMNSYSGFQNWKRQEEEKALEFLSYAERRLRELITESNLNADGPLKLFRDFYLIVCRKIVTES